MDFLTLNTLAIIMLISRATLLSATATALVKLSAIDVQTRRLPNTLVLLVALLGLAYTLVECVQLSSLTPLTSSILGMLFTAGPAAALSVFYFLIRKQEGFGAGDIKLLAALGIFLGVYGVLILPLASLCAALAMLVYKKARGQTLAFGPYISFAAVLLYATLALR
jgi:leader peptidase (prepilin peptidase)/N-methyltransferase